MAQHDKSRHITERIHISGTLILQSPAHFGNGDVRGEALVDMSLLLDDAETTPHALIPGSTIAGALRSYLRERLRGYGQEEEKDSRISDLFGPRRDNENEAAEQSLLIIEDALARQPKTILRDGVTIDPATGTALDSAKFDVELIEAGTHFDLHFELLLTEAKPAQTIVPLVLAALEGLAKGEIRLGLRKRRGYGRCQMQQWTVSRYQLTDPVQLCQWLETPQLAHQPKPATGTLNDVFSIAFPDDQSLLADTTDQRKQFSIVATFGLERSSLLIRSGFGEADLGADFVHLHALDEHGQSRPTIPGTSWAGVIRHRVLRIANTLANETGQRHKVKDVIESLFGRVSSKEEAEELRLRYTQESSKASKASRATFDETFVEDAQQLYQTRVRIDRFTGGAYESALFEEAPIYGTDKTRIGFQLYVREPQNHEIGLLLLVLKDLWTGDLPIGGEASVGRGRLTGIHAAIHLPTTDTDLKQIELYREQPNLGLSDAQRTYLQQQYVDDLWLYLGGTMEGNDGR